MSNLLDQAIVDAEALKEVAMRNAESVILDKFSAQIKEAVDQILDEEEMELDDAEDEEMSAPLEDEPEIPLASAGGLEMCPCPNDEDVIVTLKLDDLEQKVDASDKEPSEVIAGEIESALDAAPADEEESELELEEEMLTETVFENSDPTTEFTLEEDLLEELMSMIDEDTFIDNPQSRAADMEAAALQGNPEEAAYAAKTLGESNESEEVVEEALTVDIDPLATQKSGNMNTPNAVFELAEEQLLAALQDSERREKHDEMQKALKDLQESYNKLQADAETLASKKKELIGVVGTLKDRLNESNLSNAKLLYTNKVLMSDSLNERQKNKIVEALSNSESVEEAKVIYETLQSATGSTIKNNQPESLSEAMNKTTSTLILSHRKRDRENTPQNDSSVERWKILAGLTKK